jgi:hypothetical protein
MKTTEVFSVAYPRQMRPSKYDGAHFLCYLNEKPVTYKPDENSDPIDGFSYTGPMPDGGTLIDCDEWNRDKLINGIIRSKYLQTEEDAIKTHQIQLLQAKAGMEIGALPDDKAAEYVNEWNEFQTFRQNAINLVNSWDKWE